METILQKKLSIDKTKWTAVKFGEVVFEPKESSKDPVADGIKHVVGLEHIESENIHLRKSETLEESTTFTKKFAIGDVLFGRRRAYLRKASQASFNGICSGDITVFRAKENLMPELLPFVVNNEKFFDYAIKHSAGGLSPRVKFKDLANYEFLLPPKDQQAQLAKLLWAMDEVIENNLILLEKVELTERMSLAELFESGQIIKQVPIKELYKKKLKSLSPTTFINDIVFHYSLPSFMENHAPEKVEGGTIKSNKLLIDKDVVLFSKLNPSAPKIWAVTGNSEHDRLGSTEWLPVIPNDDFSVNYILAFLSSQTFLKRVMRFVQGTSNSHKRVDPKRFYELKIPLLMESDSKNIVECLLSFRTSKKNIDSTIRDSKSLQKSLINQIF